MLTIVTIPRAFDGDAGERQDAAIESWRRLGDVQIILCGDDEGVADAAARHGCALHPHLGRTPFGTPRLDDAFSAADRLARHDTICYVNADILLLSGFEQALAFVTASRFLVVGRRLNIWLDEPVSFEDSRWDGRLWRLAEREGVYSTSLSSDYFIYRRNSLTTIPPFAVGRPYWDNWMMYNAWRSGWPLIDATPVIRAVHQNHGYDHVPHATGPMWQGPEGEHNLALAGGYHTVFGLDDATHVLRADGLYPLGGVGRRLRRLRRHVESMPGASLLRAGVRLIRSGPRLSA